MQDTEFGLAPVTVDELVMLIAEESDRRREEEEAAAKVMEAAAKVMEEEAPEVVAPGMVTCLEAAAVRGVDAVEFAADPINRYNVARGVIRLVAWSARKLRG